MIKSLLQKVKLPIDNWDDNRNIQWICLKVSMVMVTMLFLFYTLWTREGQPFPSGICTQIDCSYFATYPAKVIVGVLIVLAATLYITETSMTLALSILTFFAILILSLEESHANPAENGMISLIFFVQLIAYLLYLIFPSSHLGRNRVQFAVQIIAAAYTLSGISKLNASGAAWFTEDIPKFSLEILRVYYGKYATTGLLQDKLQAWTLADYVMSHRWSMIVILGGTVILELCAFIILLNRKAAFIYGILLLAMHAGIYFFMNITFPTIMLPMLVFTINPLYCAYLLVNSFMPLQGSRT
jgi:hypothetical protein